MKVWMPPVAPAGDPPSVHEYDAGSVAVATFLYTSNELEVADALSIRRTSVQPAGRLTVAVEGVTPIEAIMT